MSAGPFLEPGRAQAAATRLRDQGFTLDLRESRDEVWVGQWVRLDQLPNADAATAALAGLRAAGLTDAYLMTDEAPGTVISLGVFATRSARRISRGSRATPVTKQPSAIDSAQPMSPGSISIVARTRASPRSSRCRQARAPRRGSNCVRAGTHSRRSGQRRRERGDLDREQMSAVGRGRRARIAPSDQSRAPA